VRGEGYLFEGPEFPKKLAKEANCSNRSLVDVERSSPMEKDPQTFVEFILDRERWGPGYEELVAALKDEVVSAQLQDVFYQYLTYCELIVPTCPQKTRNHVQ
jgi:hypothetical protein